MAEAAAASKRAEFDRIIAVRGNERKLFEAEEELRLKRRSAQHEVEMAILAAEKAEAIANAKLNAVEQSILQEESSYLRVEQKDIEEEDTESRTKAWVDTHKHNPKHEPELQHPNLDNTFVMPDSTENGHRLPPATNPLSTEQVQTEQGEAKQRACS